MSWHSEIAINSWIAGLYFILSQLFVIAAILGFRALFAGDAHAPRHLVFASLGLFVGCQGFFLGCGAHHLELAMHLYSSPPGYTLRAHMSTLHMAVMEWMQALGGTLAVICTLWIIGSTVQVNRRKRANDDG